MPRYELTNEFFWTISQSGASLQTSVGKIGNAGHTRVKAYASATEAAREYKRLIAEKLEQGYVLTDDPLVATVPGSPKSKQPKR